MRNIVTIDPSLISTALVVKTPNNFKMFNYCREKDAYGKKSMNKWFKICEQHIEYKFIEYREFKDYSEGEITKLKDYDKITDQIIDDIKTIIDDNLETIVGIEGYNFGAQVGDLVDLVVFSTLLRNKLYDKISKNIRIFSPSTLKLETCKLTYKPIVKEIGGKNPRTEYIWKNTIGMPGGKFSKHDIYMAIVENNTFNDNWAILCKSLEEDILNVSKVPKPMEDINDAWVMCKILENI